MMTKIKKFLLGFFVCALCMGAYPVSVYGAELSPSTEESTESTEITEDTRVPEEPEEKTWVIVLDPGHGGVDGGASRTINGVKYVERDLALKIALYCKAELEKYDNVVVYMTRTDNSSTNMDRQQRAYYAASVGADVLVSFHLNATSATTSYSQTGAEVYYPNSNYKLDISQSGWHMSKSILLELQNVGVYNNGTKIRNTEDGTLYPDGSKGDYLGINYWSKMYGFPGILIEHAYINNPSDVANFLSTEEGLKRLGVADAIGIMNSLNSGEFSYEKGVGGQWMQSANGKWWFQYAGGGWPENQWLNIWGKWYYFDAEGYMTYGWQYIDGYWYYLGDANDGAMKTGWQFINNHWYFFVSSGEMSSGWQWINGRWYYLGAADDGSMKTGWQKIKGEWYYMDETGSGAMQSGWQKVAGKWYYLGVANDGAMKTGWQYINGKWYYMYDNGVMAANTWIGSYYVNASGAWVKK